MGDVHYLRDVPEGQLAVIPQRVLGEGAGVAVVHPALLDRLAVYDCSTPTAPSAGRIYRQGRWLAIVQDDPSDLKFQLHVPHEIWTVNGPVRIGRS